MDIVDGVHAEQVYAGTRPYREGVVNREAFVHDGDDFGTLVNVPLYVHVVGPNVVNVDRHVHDETKRA